ncbi:MAG: MotA/TolQ/ExbB proton channel family protein [Candidatus Brocadia sp. BROELEC01]|nr:MotA/TolQ/ExbB proton channel family protein [Candidatus Brocadia sapporoensis]MEB2309190.1 MotA/TolQ/ExbB proton channel family protein [Candidatus Brocadiaceae bacterium]QQR67608.1 MAG: MotA/TolQ/ExbB proton channel family protein [Candidatus Brocadia sp.]RZV59008.1 MAG: MotA/TolQ/ExbB proton channel family protein [Candidatus Brocadia sp. BROELEC01]
MFHLFLRGGPVMWPILVASVAALTVVIERIYFLISERKSRCPEIIEKIFSEVERGKIEEALRIGAGCNDFVATTLVYGLRHRHKAFSNALLQAANKELKRFGRGLPVLDTVITLGPLLGLFGTVTGMIHAFGLLGGRELDSPTVITGGIAEALIATAYGLLTAIVALIPFNYFNARLEEARHEIEDATTHLELLLLKQDKNP